MDITQLELRDLKALAYDENYKIELARQNLVVLNTEIQKRLKPEVSPNDTAASKDA